MKKLLILFLMLLMAAPAFAVGWDDVDFGGHVRLRGYAFDNMWDFNDKNDFDKWNTFRLRTSIQTKVNLPKNVTAFVKLTNQTYGEGVTYPQGGGNFGVANVNGKNWESDNMSNKVFVDNAYVNVAKAFGTPVSLRIGRQNLMYGSGFVLFDGQSQFASTSLYFDGIKVSVNLGKNAVLDGLYFKDQENDRSNATGDDITLSGAYLTAHCPVIGGQQELYALNRNDQLLDKDIWMYGLRISDKFDCGLDYSGEIAYQFGKFYDSDTPYPHEGKLKGATDIDQDALGYKLDAGFTFKDLPVSPRLFLGYVYLSGDENGSKDENERWDVFYGGWPQFGDLLAWKYVNIGSANSISDYDPNWNEGSSTPGDAPYSNLKIATAGIGAKLLPNLSAQFSYSLLTVDESDPAAASQDDDFGDYYQLKAKYDYSKNLAFALYAAMIDPGDAFINDDEAYEVFWETKVSF